MLEVWSSIANEVSGALTLYTHMQHVCKERFSYAGGCFDPGKAQTLWKLKSYPEQRGDKLGVREGDQTAWEVWNCPKLEVVLNPASCPNCSKNKTKPDLIG